MLNEFLDVWNEVSAFIAPEFRPVVSIKEDYCPYGSDLPCKAAIFDDKYAAYVTFREWAKGADEVVQVEFINSEKDDAVISNTTYYFNAFMLMQVILTEWRWKLRSEGKR